MKFAIIRPANEKDAAKRLIRAINEVNQLLKYLKRKKVDVGISTISSSVFGGAVREVIIDYIEKRIDLK